MHGRYFLILKGVWKQCRRGEALYHMMTSYKVGFRFWITYLQLAIKRDLFQKEGSLLMNAKMKLIMSIKLILNKRIYNKRLSDTVLLCTLLHSLFDEGEMQIFRTSAVTMFTFQLCPLTQVRKSSPMWNTEVVGLQQRSHVNFRAKLHLKSSNSVCKQTHSDSSWK